MSNERKIVPKFQKKPVIIEAMQYPGILQFADAEKVLEWLDENNVNYQHENVVKGFHGLIIETLEGNMRADPGDWIIKGVKGEFYPCKPDIFEATYDPVMKSSKSSKDSSPHKELREDAEHLILAGEHEVGQRAVSVAQGWLDLFEQLAAVTVERDRLFRENLRLGKALALERSPSNPANAHDRTVMSREQLQRSQIERQSKPASEPPAPDPRLIKRLTTDGTQVSNQDKSSE